jgi:glucosamine--fructose-6-phosphate aminotransferase (isomerizing)
MSGLIGILGKADVAPLLVESLVRLEDWRGESCGLAVVDEALGIDVRKGVGRVEEVAERFDMISARGRTGIAYGRWPTHGNVAPENAHPHLSCDHNFAVVHSGLIANHQEIRQALLRERGNHFFFSDTDTEVIAHLMEEIYRPGLSVERAFVRMLRHLEGTFAIALISIHEPGQIFCARRKVPLFLGIDAETKFVGSDIHVFLPHIRRGVPLEDDEYAVLLPDGYWIRDIANGEQRNGRVTEIL